MEKEKRKSTIAIAVSPGVPRVKQHVLLWEIQTTNNSWLTLLHAPPSGRNEPFPHFVNFLLRDEKAEGEGEGVEDGKNRKNEKVEMKHRSRCGWCWRDQINICPYIYKYRGKEIIAAPPTHTHKRCTCFQRALRTGWEPSRNLQAEVALFVPFLNAEFSFPSILCGRWLAFLTSY